MKRIWFHWHSFSISFVTFDEAAVALRYANVYGPRQNSKGEAGVVAIFIERKLRGEKATINGDGEQTRDFVYVGDVVAANMAVADSADPGPFNVGTSVETSVDRLQRFPYSGRVLPEIGLPEYREVLYGSHRLIYKIREKTVAILTVRHSKQLFYRDELTDNPSR